jgi:hypothetical protein
VNAILVERAPNTGSKPVRIRLPANMVTLNQPRRKSHQWPVVILLDNEQSIP